MPNTLNAAESNGLEPCLGLPFHGVDATLAERSGGYSSANPICMFLFLLMRDHLPTTKIEQLVQDCSIAADGVAYSNAYLAKYAEDLAIRLSGVDQDFSEYTLKVDNTYEDRRRLATYLGVPTERISDIEVQDSTGHMLRRVQEVNLKTGVAVVYLPTDVSTAVVDGELVEAVADLSGCKLHFNRPDPDWPVLDDITIPITGI